MVNAPKASSLITTLLVLVVLSTIVVAFMQSMSVERSVAKSVRNQYRAEEASRTGIQVAQSIIRSAISQFPDSATVWETNLAGLGSSGTALFYWSSPPPSTNAKLYYLPLVSGALTNVLYTNRSLAVTNTTNTLSLNSARFSFDNAPWIGTAPDGSAPLILAPWVEIRDLNNVLIGRYAFWVEDESFKVNLAVATNAPVGSKILTNGTDVPLSGIFSRITNTGPSIATNVANMRDSLSISTLATINQASGVPTNLASKVKFITSMTASSMNFSRSGFRRINLNLIPSSSTNPATARLELDKIIYGITNSMPRFGQRFYRTSTNLNATNEVLSGSGPATNNHELIYVTKIAANIRDYISTNNQPTIVNNDSTFSVRGPGVPAFAIGAIGGGLTNPNETVAIGKKQVPNCEEYGLRGRLVSLSIPGKPWGASDPGPGANYEFYLDHYLEFCNFTDHDITLSDLGPNSFIKIYNQPAFDTGAGGTSIPEGGPQREIVIPLSAFIDAAGNPLVFRANSVTVLTTDENPDATFTPNPAIIYRPNLATLAIIDSKRHFIGKTYKLGSGTINDINQTNGYSKPYRIDLVQRTTGGSDYESEFLIGNDLGLIEGFCSLPIARTSGGVLPLSFDNDTFLSSPKTNNIMYFVRGGSLYGNASPAPSAGQMGDARAASEQLFININPASDRTRYNNTLDNNSVPGSSTVNAFNTNFIEPKTWPDYSTWTNGGGSAPMHIARAPMQSIGELGHIYDPVRFVGTSGDIALSRGGGRTLRIGQSEYKKTFASAPTVALSSPAYFGIWDGSQTNASRNWTSWRLCDVFGTDGDLEKEGTINPNGALRDQGTAIRAVIEGLTISSTNMPSQAIDQLINALTNRLASASTYAGRGGPFYERGEISELDVFNQATNFPVNGGSSSAIIDRSREELVRRIIEIITTRGSVFTVYCVGQAIKDTSTGLKIEATASMKVTFKIAPIYFDSTGSRTSPPGTVLFETSSTWPSQLDISNRFRKPDAYEIQVLSHN